MLKTEAVAGFLQFHGTSPYSKRYNPKMELQVNVAQDEGDRIKGEYMGKRWVGWTNPATGEVWKSFRIPWQANSDPIYTDSQLKFDLSAHVEGIGMTGWDWVNKQSLWVGFDFDSITNHKEGLTDEQLEDIKESIKEVPWVTLLSSTSGRGFHIYVDFENPVATNNHTEHAALARAVLSVLSIEVGRNFENSVDVCGAVLWVWHRKQKSNGLKYLKEGSKFPAMKIPANWHDHIRVTGRSSVRIVGNKNHGSEFEELYSSTKHVELDPEHRRLLKWFATGAERDYWWDNDHNMLVCHTFDLAKAHKELSLKGIFHTSSSGSSAQNCFAFPISGGAWAIRRHSRKVNEHPSWSVDPSGWTRCVLNDEPEFTTCARSNGGLQNTKGAYVFQYAKEGLETLKQLGFDCEVPEVYQARGMTISERGDGDLVVQINREDRDDPIPGWLISRNGKQWERIFARRRKKRDFYTPDYVVRHTIAQEAEAGWWIHTRGKWINQSRNNVVSVLLAQDETSNRGDVDAILSKAILNPWELVNVPFREEYTGNRQWNLGAASFSCRPKEGTFETWKQVLEHCGQGLDDAVYKDDWCAKNAINTGAEFLACWVASMFQFPYRPLPYLFFVGPQNSGKSTFHEALHLIIKRGYARADQALMSQQGFNGEIANAVLCVVEETNLSVHKAAANRIKDWVTGKTISIRALHKGAYDIVNTTHWVQAANDSSYCPVFSGDTRVIACFVDKPEGEIPKHELFDRLEEEKAAFLHYLLSIELPNPPGRLGLPCLITEEKERMIGYNQDELEQFLHERIEVCEGASITFEDFFNAFQLALPTDIRGNWTKKRVGQQYPQTRPYVKGIHGSSNTMTLGNIKFAGENARFEPNTIWVKKGNRLSLVPKG